MNLKHLFLRLPRSKSHLCVSKCKNTKWCQTFQVRTFEVRRNLTENNWRRWTQRLRMEEFLNIKRFKNITHFPSKKCSGFGWATRNFRSIARNSSALLRLADTDSPRKAYTFICGIRLDVSLPVSYLRLFSLLFQLQFYLYTLATHAVAAYPPQSYQLIEIYFLILGRFVVLFILLKTLWRIV